MNNSIVNFREVPPRVERLGKVIGQSLFESLLWKNDYTTDYLDKDLRQKIKDGTFRKIVFYGMGCSSVVSDIIKGFFIEYNVPIDVEVVNDYQTEWFVNSNELEDDLTLSIIVCYSGWSVEPIKFYENMMERTNNKNLIVLSGGGKIAKMAIDDKTSLIQYRLRHADREYPLYHVQQFFSIFLDIFYNLGLLDSDFEDELQSCVSYLNDKFDDSIVNRAKDTASRLKDSRVVLLSSAKWYTILLKQTTMFINEIAMVPTHRNLLHEFTHTEVAAYSNPSQKQAIITLVDSDDDEYTKDKVETMQAIFTSQKERGNQNIEFIKITLDQPGFFNKFFFTHFYMVYVAYFLGIESNFEGRDLISRTAKNPWWSEKNIEKFPSCVDIPHNLNVDKEEKTESQVHQVRA